MLQFGRSRSPSPPPRKMTELEAPFATAHGNAVGRTIRTSGSDQTHRPPRNGRPRPTWRFSPSARPASPIRSRSRRLPILAHGRGFQPFAAAWAGYTVGASNNFVFEMHQYLDSDGSTHLTCATGSGTKLSAATSWLATNGFQGFSASSHGPKTRPVLPHLCSS
jgi:hypothetical protein